MQRCLMACEEGSRREGNFEQRKIDAFVKSPKTVIPAKAGIHK
jgi:hypothetical protein